MADHQTEPEARVTIEVLAGQGVEGVQRLVAHGAAVRARVSGRQERQRDSAGTRMDERIVEAVDVGRQHARPVRVAVAQQPQLLLLTDVREVPHQWAHQRVVLATQFVVVEVDQPQRAVARLRQLTREFFA